MRSVWRALQCQTRDLNPSPYFLCQPRGLRLSPRLLCLWLQDQGCLCVCVTEISYLSLFSQFYFPCFWLQTYCMRSVCYHASFVFVATDMRHQSVIVPLVSVIIQTWHLKSITLLLVSMIMLKPWDLSLPLFPLCFCNFGHELSICCLGPLFLWLQTKYVSQSLPLLCLWLRTWGLRLHPDLYGSKHTTIATFMTLNHRPNCWVAKDIFHCFFSDTELTFSSGHIISHFQWFIGCFGVRFALISLPLSLLGLP